MKKKVLIVMLLVVIIMVLVIGILFTNWPIIQGKLYSGDHIKMRINLLYNGEKIAVDANNVTCIYEDGNECVVNFDNGVYSVKGGKYGQYRFFISVPGEVLPEYGHELNICLGYINANNWYISESDCTIDLSKQDGVLCGDVMINTACNDGRTTCYDANVGVHEYLLEVEWGL